MFLDIFELDSNISFLEMNDHCPKDVVRGGDLIVRISLTCGNGNPEIRRTKFPLNRLPARTVWPGTHSGGQE